MANKRVIELNERTQIDLSDWLLVDSSTSTRKLSIATLLSYFTYYSLIFVDELPTQDIQPNVVYLVPHSGSDTQWDEYIYINNEWSLIGTSTIDLSAIYQTKAAATVQDNNIPWYGTSSTAAGTTAKVATTAARNLGALAAGQKVSIKFTNANTASAPTLNVDGKGAHAIKSYGTTAPTVWWKAGDVVTFTYDGTNWIMGATQAEIEQINSNLTNRLDIKYTDVNVTLVQTTGPDPFTYAGESNLTLSGAKIINVTPMAPDGNWVVVANIKDSSQNSFYLYANGQGTIKARVAYIVTS